jgi:HAE1 family hydrophobic/amphiphilic exporter-1
MSPQLNWVSRLTGYFLHRPRISIVIFILLVLVGVAALSGLRREGFPQVPVKIVVINTLYKGAVATEIEQAVTNPIEAAIQDVADIKSVNSTSRDSLSSVVVTLDESADLDANLQTITSKVSGITLPEDAEKPQITQPVTGNSAFVYGLYNDQLTPQELLAQGRIFAREISQIKGMKRVELAGDYQEKITLTINPAALARSGVDPAAIQSALAANNLNLPAGANLTLDGSRSSLLVSGGFTSLADLAATPIPTRAGSNVRLDNLATISRGVDENGVINRIGRLENGRPISHHGLVYNLDIRSDADILVVEEDLSETVSRLTKNGALADNTQLIRLFDDAANTADQIHEIEAGAIGQKWEGIGPLGFVGYAVGGIWLLMLAMFLFVNLRNALIAGIAIPLSFLATLIVLYLNGITLNTLTLFAMILVLGLVVDPAIVVLESIQRYKDMGRTGREGVIAAVNSIGPGLLLATLCSIIVFTPFGIVSGVFGEVIRYIPVTVIPALVASFFVPLIFLAPLAGRFIKARPGHESDTNEEATLWPVSRWFKQANLFILNRLWLQIIIMVLAVTLPIGLTYYLFASGRVVPAQFSKPPDTTEALVAVSFPASFTNDRIATLSKDVESILAKHPEIKSYYYTAQNPTNFTIYLSLTPTSDRTTTSEALANQLQAKLPTNQTVGIYSRARSLSAGTPESEFPVQIQVYDSDLSKLKTFALDLAKEARRTEGVIRVSDGYTDAGTSAVRATVNPGAASSRGLTTASIGGQLAGLLGEQPLTKITLDGNQVDVVSRLETKTPESLTTLQSLNLNTPTGPIPLRDTATISTDTSAGVISHQDGQRYATVRAQVDDKHSAADIQAKLSNWADSRLKDYGLHDDALANKGENEDIAESFTNLFVALGIAVLMIYLVLALFFQSFLKPVIITFALPLSFLGVFPILALLGTEFGFLEILGLITLAGIVVNVGIFVIDYANRRVAAGVPVKEAIATATAVRFRPIFLTKVTAAGSLLPLALLSPFWRSLSSVIIAGIITSGVLSLFTTPILYSWFSAWSRLPNRYLRARKASRISSKTSS